MFKAKVNASHVFEISETTLEALDIVETTKNHYHILDANKTVKAAITNADYSKKQYTVSVNNNSYTVRLSDVLDQQIEALGFEIGASKRINDIKAPMPGLILDINVKEGQEVKEDESLLILEAMKMENVINSPRAGVIKTIKVAQGDTVDKNTLLIVFE